MNDSFQHKLALVTGASSGIGEWFARHLARQGADLILVARRADRLEQLKQEFTAQGAKVWVIVQDLAEVGSAQKLWAQIGALDLQVDVLINNAGFGKHGEFLDVDLAQHSNMLQLNINALTELTWLFAQDMKQRHTGHILLVASIAAYMPIPEFSTYAASKAFVLSFGQSLHNELRPYGVNVTVLSPGGVATEFMEISGQKIDDWRTLAIMRPERVAAAALTALRRGNRVVMPGWMYKLSMPGLRFIPSALQMIIGRMVTH